MKTAPLKSAGAKDLVYIRCSWHKLSVQSDKRLRNSFNKSQQSRQQTFRPYCSNLYTVDKILQKRISGAAALWINEKKNLTEILKFILDLESWDSCFTIDIKCRLLTKKCLSYKGLSIQHTLISLSAPALQIYWS